MPSTKPSPTPWTASQPPTSGPGPCFAATPSLQRESGLVRGLGPVHERAVQVDGDLGVGRKARRAVVRVVVRLRESREVALVDAGTDLGRGAGGQRHRPRGETEREGVV